MTGDGAREQPSREDLERDVRRTREDLAETVDALSAKLDVKAQAREKARGASKTVRTSAHDPARQYAAAAVVLAAAAAVVWLTGRRG